MRKLVCSEASLYHLYLEPSGTYILQAEVNRSATYSVSFSLNADEVAAFELQGPAFAQELALRVDSDPDSFRSRAI